MSAEDLLTTEEMADVMGWARATVYSRTRAGRALPPRVDDSRVPRYRRGDVDAFKVALADEAAAATAARLAKPRKRPVPAPRAPRVARPPRPTPPPKPLTLEEQIARQRRRGGTSPAPRVGYAIPPGPGEVVAVRGLIARRATGPGEASLLAAMILGDAA
ncbi:putative DNA-binding transcriptional regulator AlpA [Mycetocola sp. BIGb0189]|uniref:hypothetical protein n=1 Tax=Mycetocola sp. BIGb0189 TaxID=2940604 RepID=UPI00216A8693|nr:hypothetical protein [Mycetocola sp. BIGb0189]MCS4277914.1 putative DNA-binding transcriptional regulator AlpA [Mycetocola sp. BIGb0189]